MLIDRAAIFVRSGRGGDGCVSFRREKYVPKGGPDGGDGGRGGDVTLVGEASLTTLLPLAQRPHRRAGNGQPGMGRSMHGADGEACLVPVPPGTLVFDDDGGVLLADIVHDGQRVVVAAGGRGGFGNEHFKSATNQTPREATPGEPAVERTLRLELKLIADVGLIGLPNAGKSTLLRAVSRATPKVADYPFTTLTPYLGIAEVPGDGAPRRMVVADIPGLIEGAARGAGLGHDFLRHVERTRLLVHVIDVGAPAGSVPLGRYEAIRGELRDYSEALAAKPQIVALNKIDLLTPARRQAVAGELAARLGGEALAVLALSGATTEGVGALLEACWRGQGRAPARGWAAPPHRARP